MDSSANDILLKNEPLKSSKVEKPAAAASNATPRILKSVASSKRSQRGAVANKSQNVNGEAEPHGHDEELTGVVVMTPGRMKMSPRPSIRPDQRYRPGRKPVNFKSKSADFKRAPAEN